jgi:hypothetical protein
MQFLVHTGAAIIHDDYPVIIVGGMSSGSLDHVVGGHARHHQRIYASVIQKLFEIRILKGVDAILFYYGFSFNRSKRFMDIASPRILYALRAFLTGINHFLISRSATCWRITHNLD